MAPPVTPLSERFWRHVDKTETCWLWTGCTRGNGYGAIWVGSRKDGSHKMAHRVCWELMLGPIPEGRMLLHKCDVRNCVRPSHLFLGNHQMNMADMTAKARQARGAAITAGRTSPRGERNGNVRLRESDIPKIRKLYTDGFSSIWIANAYGVSKKTILNILHGRTWAQVP